MMKRKRRATFRFTSMCVRETERDRAERHREGERGREGRERERERERAREKTTSFNVDSRQHLHNFILQLECRLTCGVRRIRSPDISVSI